MLFLKLAFDIAQINIDVYLIRKRFRTGNFFNLTLLEFDDLLKHRIIVLSCGGGSRPYELSWAANHIQLLELTEQMFPLRSHFHCPSRGIKPTAWRPEHHNAHHGGIELLEWKLGVLWRFGRIMKFRGIRYSRWKLLFGRIVVKICYSKIEEIQSYWFITFAKNLQIDIGNKLILICIITYIQYHCASYFIVYIHKLDTLCSHFLCHEQLEGGQCRRQNRQKSSVINFVLRGTVSTCSSLLQLSRVVGRLDSIIF